VVSALEGLHAAGIIYRSVQPEGIHIDAMGRIVLVDYAVSKVGCVGWKTFTLCGVPDYLAPEQLSQRGHNEAVDYWELGLLLYELLARENPFSATNPNELAVMHKITQFGQISFSQLQFPESFPHRLIQLINRLVVPIPEQRLGVMDGGSELLMRQEYFHEIVWSELAQRPSPLREYAEEMRVENLAEGLSSDITEKWQAAEGSSSRIRSATWMEELLRELQ
jgi:serine/threonine protein kinase